MRFGVGVRPEKARLDGEALVLCVVDVGTLKAQAGLRNACHPSMSTVLVEVASTDPAGDMGLPATVTQFVLAASGQDMEFDGASQACRSGPSSTPCPCDPNFFISESDGALRSCK